MLYVISICLISNYFPMFNSTKNFYILTISLLIIVIPLMYILLDQNPLIWIFYFCSKTNKVNNNNLQYILYEYEITFNTYKYYRSS